ncbi:MAG: hypothetical protein GQ527_06315 [Bacteroidales bacterium]|nr:hypothetical protein [Bacteroidales bacterium]
MKNLFLLISILFLSFHLFAQNPNIISPQLTNKTWVDGETRSINEYQVTLVSGADYGNSRNASSGMITSVAYKKENAKGQLEFYITRYEESLANLKWFMIIIRGEDDKEKILEQKLDAKTAELPNGNYYWNYTTIDLPENIHPPFYVYIRDRNREMLFSTKFLIEE